MITVAGRIVGKRAAEICPSGGSSAGAASAAGLDPSRNAVVRPLVAGLLASLLVRKAIGRVGYIGPGSAGGRTSLGNPWLAHDTRLPLRPACGVTGSGRGAAGYPADSSLPLGALGAGAEAPWAGVLRARRARPASLCCIRALGLLTRGPHGRSAVVLGGLGV